ncbi:MAG: sortase [Peptoniphilaceae bacterium]|nr:sortase [Peptoniphilaceae bacterium]MDY6018522.1 sortase [Anaerococcus sp.]
MKSKIFKALGLSLIIFGICLTFYNIIMSNKADKAGKEVVKKLATAKEDLPNDEIDLNIPIKNINGIDFIGELEIPAIGKKLPITAAWSYDLMKSFPNKYMGKSYDQPLIIMAHNYKSHFGDLPKLKENDKIIFVDVLGRKISYQVVAREIIDGYDVKDMLNSAYDLSLFTCNIWDRSTRFTIRANRIENEF